jgi:hypothetical protein
VGLATPPAVVAVHRCDACECGDQDCDGGSADSRDRLEQIGLAYKIGIGGDFVVDACIAAGDLALKEEKMLADRCERIGIVKALQTLLFGGQHIDQLPPPAHLLGQASHMLGSLGGFRRLHRPSEP